MQGTVHCQFKGKGDFVEVHAELKNGQLVCRADSFEISPTGPIFGTHMLAAEGEPGRREREIFERWEIGDGRIQLPRGIRLRGSRRPLRVRPVDLRLHGEPDDAVRVEVTLPPGSYVTVLIEELFGVFDHAPPSAVS